VSSNPEEKKGFRRRASVSGHASTDRGRAIFDDFFGGRVSIEGEQSGGESSAPPPLQSNAWEGGGRDLSAKKLLEEYERQQMLYIPGAFLAGDSVDEVSERERQKARESRREQERTIENKRETEQDRTSGEGTDSNEEEIGGWVCW